jgi:hypothetical protein
MLRNIAKFVLPLALALPVLVYGQAPKAPTAPQAPPVAAAKPTTPPVISDALRAQFFKAQSHQIQADQVAQQAKTEFQAAVDALRATCGDVSTLSLNAAGDPECVAKPVPAPTK